MRILLFIPVLLFIAGTAIAQKPFTVNDLPSKWTELNEVNKELVIFSPCDADNGSIEITNQKDVRKIMIGFGHEALSFVVEKVRTHNNTSTKETSFLFLGKYEYVEPQKLDTLELRYNPATKRGTLIAHLGGYANTRIFTADENLGAYKHITQPCRECWPPEECDAMENPPAPADKNGFEGTYIDNYDKSGYWQRMTIKRIENNTYNVDITFGGSVKGCTFNGTGELKKGRIEIDLSKISNELDATMIIENKGDIMDVSTTKFDQRFDLMYFCGGGASLGIEYYREK